MNDTVGYCANYQTFLEKYYQRSQYLANLIQIVNGSFLTIFLAFFTVTLNNNNGVKVLIVCISILFFWRFYIHFIDNEMIDVYSRIIYCEDKIEIFDDKISLKGSIKRQINDQIFFSNRGQFYFDFFAFLIICALSINTWLISNKNYLILENWYLSCFAGIEILVYIIFIIYITRKDKNRIKKLIV